MYMNRGYSQVGGQPASRRGECPPCPPVSCTEILREAGDKAKQISLVAQLWHTPINMFVEVPVPVWYGPSTSTHHFHNLAH